MRNQALGLHTNAGNELQLGLIVYSNSAFILLIDKMDMRPLFLSLKRASSLLKSLLPLGHTVPWEGPVARLMPWLWPSLLEPWSASARPRRAHLEQSDQVSV